MLAILSVTAWRAAAGSNSDIGSLGVLGMRSLVASCSPAALGRGNLWSALALDCGICGVVCSGGICSVLCSDRIYSVGLSHTRCIVHCVTRSIRIMPGDGISGSRALGDAALRRQDLRRGL